MWQHPETPVATSPPVSVTTKTDLHNDRLEQLNIYYSSVVHVSLASLVIFDLGFGCSSWKSPRNICLDSSRERASPVVFGLCKTVAVLAQASARSVATQLSDQSTRDAVTMATEFAIGTLKAFQNGIEFHYTKEEINGEVVYACSKGSQWSRPDEMLILRKKTRFWIAWDSSRVDDMLQVRQPVYRSDVDITKEGLHIWQTNVMASSDEGDDYVEWKGEHFAETRRNDNREKHA